MSRQPCPQVPQIALSTNAQMTMFTGAPDRPCSWVPQMAVSTNAPDSHVHKCSRWPCPQVSQMTVSTSAPDSRSDSKGSGRGSYFNPRSHTSVLRAMTNTLSQTPKERRRHHDLTGPTDNSRNRQTQIIKFCNHETHMIENIESWKATPWRFSLQALRTELRPGKA